MEKVTVLIPVYNEEINIRRCLESVQWADEILVVDSFSSDRTLDIVKEFHVRILQREYESHASQRNWAIPQASHEWILLLDADEEVSEELAAEIQQVLSESPARDAYRIKRRNFFFGKEIKHGGWGNDWIVRFFHRDRCRIEEWGFHGDIHIDGKVPSLKGALIHSTYKSMDDYFDKLNRYTTQGAKLLYRKGKRATLLHLLFHPAWKFIHSYFIRAGFLDGLRGLLISTLASFYVFAKYVKLWYYQTIQKPE